MSTKINIKDFHQLSKDIPVVDVRTPKEFATGHISNAINIPLFNNEERAVVGTIYKQVNRNSAILKGLEIVGPKLKDFAKKIHNTAKSHKVIVYCWRGGMRSASMAWLFETVGIKTYIINGGYKSYRKYGKSLFNNFNKLIILGGLTGSGKTEILNELQKQGEQIIDLENIAHHKGSVFGMLGQEKQPTNEQFENNIIYNWLDLDLSKPVWIEDESHSIGSNWIPEELFNLMRNAPVINIELDKNIRIKRLVNEYAGFDPKLLENCILKIEKRLGGQNVKQALKSLQNNDLGTVADIVLRYYDKSYTFGLKKRNNQIVFSIKLKVDNPKENSGKIINFAKKVFTSQFIS